MKTVAFIVMRNAEPYLHRSLQHICSEGVEVILVDNGSTDRSREVGEQFLSMGVTAIYDLPYSGAFDLTANLHYEYQLALSTDIAYRS